MANSVNPDKTALSGAVGSGSALFAYIILFKTLVDASRIHTHIILTPCKPHFYTVKLGFTGGIHFFSYFCSKT